MRFAWLLLLLAACTDDLSVPELVVDLRVLAVRAVPPAGVVGTRVTLDALVAGGVPTGQTWWACVAAGGSQEGPEACAAAMPAVACADAPEATSCLLGEGATAEYTLPAQALVGRAADEDGQVFVVLSTTDGTRTTVAAKRVAVTRIPSAATNPVVADLVIAGTDVAVTVPAATDSLFLSWYVTAGALGDFRTSPVGAGLHNQWTPVNAAGSIFVVVRDGVGGESWVAGSR